MGITLKISQKGLILVAVPLLFELFFVTVLVMLHRQAEDEIKREVYSKTVIEHADKVMIDIMGLATSTSSYGLNVKDPAMVVTAQMQYQDANNDIHEHFRTLEELVKDRPEHQKLLQHMRETFLRYDDLVKQSENALLDKETDRMQRNVIIFRGLRSMSTLLQDMKNDMDTFLAAERQVEKESPQVQARNRQLVEEALFIGIGFNVLLAFGLARYFSRGIAERLKVIHGNTTHLSKGEALNKPLVGNDEIADVDRVFHDMADRLKELDRLKKEFVAMVSHDLRTPLMSIQALLELLEAGVLGELSEKGQKRMQGAQSDVERLIALINDLLDIERIESGKMDMSFKEIQLAHAIERSVASVKSLTDSRNVAITTETTDVILTADEDRLVQVLVNLLSNAIKFSPSGAKVEVSVVSSKDDAVVRIKDYGRGIPPKFKDAIFDRFRQVEVADAVQKGGSGLGLAICKAIIEQHGGSIGVDSEEGKGSLFWFKLPKVGTFQPDVTAKQSSRVAEKSHVQPVHAEEESSQAL